MNLFRKFIAYFRLNKRSVCEESAKGGRDYHDYPDSTSVRPFHFTPHFCKRCGKKFWI